MTIFPPNLTVLVPYMTVFVPNMTVFDTDTDTETDTDNGAHIGSYFDFNQVVLYLGL